MSRSQQHKVYVQGFASDGQAIAEGVHNPFNPFDDDEGGAPEWVPEGALAHLDFLEERYFADGEVRSIGDVATAWEPTLDVGADGLNEFLESTELVEGVMTPGSMCLVWEWKDLNGPAENRAIANGDDTPNGNGFEIAIWSSGKVTATDYNGAYLESVGTVVAGGINRLAVSWTSLDTLHFSLNGETAITDAGTVGHFDSPWDYLIYWKVNLIGAEALRYFTAYPEKSAAELPALSALS